MRSNLLQILYESIPPIVWRIYRRLILHEGYYGNFPGWDQARNSSTGYVTDLILQRVRDALLKVKSGEAVYERDSVLFEKVRYSWPLLAGLLWIASRSGNRLNIIDFGGSLGSSYFQNRMMLEHLQELSWNVVEQENFVQCGREYFEDQTLKFYYTIDECIEAVHPRVLLLSSVLPYLEYPYELLARILSEKFAYIIIDRTPTLEGWRDRLTVQRVPVEIYKASYPAWILGRDKLLSLFESDYDLVSQFDALAGSIFLGDATAHDEGFIFRLKV